MAALAADVLEALAEASPRQLSQSCRELYAQAAEAALVPATAPDDIARLHALFDAALDGGVGGLVVDYVTEVCADRRLTSSDPVEAFLLDGECVRRWVQKLLNVSRGRLGGLLGRGLASLAGSASLLSKDLARLQMLQLVAEALPPRAEGGAAGAAAASEPAEVAEARRLAQCARVLAWLAQQQSPGFDRPTGRYFSEQEWRSVAAKRREGAAAGGATLFLADLAAELAAHGCDAGAYPPAAPDRLLASLFLGAAPAAAAAKGGTAAGGSGTSSGALNAKLALLAYYLADGGFMQPGDVVAGLQSHFHVAPTTARAWLLQQLLDEAAAADPSGAAALQRAAELAPLVDGAALPFKALHAFAARRQLDVALALLRQRPETTASLEEASVALSVRLLNGLLGEAFLGLRRHLDAAAAAAPSPAAVADVQRTHAEALLAQMLQFAASSRPSAVHAVLRMPFGAAEEQAVVGWLEAQAASTPEASLMLPLYFLLRGRTPEALHAYTGFCPRSPTTEQQQQLAALLTEAARMLPAPQRALVVQQGAAPALLPATGEDAGVALMASIADVAADGGAPLLVSVGPTPGQAPLVGSIPVLLEQQNAAAAAAEPAAGGEQGAEAADGAAQARGGHAPQPLLFGSAAAAEARTAAAAPTPGGFGSAAAAAVPFADEAMMPLAAGGHELDRALGLGGTPAGARSAAKGKRRFGGSAYR